MTGAGRKRAFDKTEALDKAMRVFWDNGYAGTSLSDLTTSLGINKPSLYAAFGNKEQLFNATLDHYVQQYGADPLKQLREPADLPFATRLENYLLAVVANNTHQDLPVGCFVVKCYCESGGNSLPEDADHALQRLRTSNEQTLTQFFVSEQQKGQLSSTLSPEALADYVLSQVYGISVMARSGKRCDELKSIVKTAVSAITNK